MGPNNTFKGIPPPRRKTPQHNGEIWATSPEEQEIIAHNRHTQVYTEDGTVIYQPVSHRHFMGGRLVYTTIPSLLIDVDFGGPNRTSLPPTAGAWMKGVEIDLGKNIKQDRPREADGSWEDLKEQGIYDAAELELIINTIGEAQQRVSKEYRMLNAVNWAAIISDQR